MLCMTVCGLNRVKITEHLQQDTLEMVTLLPQSRTHGAPRASGQSCPELGGSLSYQNSPSIQGPTYASVSRAKWPAFL